MDIHAMSDRKQEIIETTWHYLLKSGLSQASVGELCRETGLSQSSLYYWFENKEDIWICAGKYGLSKVIDAILGYTFDHINRVREYFDTLLSEVGKYKEELRCVIQITLSPIYGERMRDAMKEFNFLYEDYAKQLVEVFGCTHKQAEFFIYSTLSSIVDYIVWDDGEKTQVLLENLYNRIVKVLNLQ